jgi:hypothetical protein
MFNHDIVSGLTSSIYIRYLNPTVFQSVTSS